MTLYAPGYGMPQDILCPEILHALRYCMPQDIIRPEIFYAPRHCVPQDNVCTTSQGIEYLGAYNILFL